VDDGVVAVVGMSSAFAASILPVLEAARIPSIGGFVDNPIEATSPVSYPVNSGNRGTIAGSGRIAVEAGGPRVSVLYADIGSGPISAGWTSAAVKQAGGTPTEVGMQVGLPDYSAVASTALTQKPDAVVVNTVPDDAARIIGALRQAGFTGAIVGSQLTMVTSASIRALAGAAENVVTVSRCAQMDPSAGPGVQDFLAAMSKAGATDRPDDAACGAWASLMVFADAVKGTGVTDGKSVIAALDAIRSPVDSGVGAPYSGVPSTEPVKDYPRIGNWMVSASRIVNGQPVLLKPFFDVAAAAQ
jgi:ABC-type branched-subunit amino acid transport system substrate-binding protein